MKNIRTAGTGLILMSLFGFSGALAGPGELVQQGYLKSSNAGAGDGFGASMALSGETAVVGAMSEASHATGVGGSQTDNSAPDAGAVYVFTHPGLNWSQQAYLKASNTEADERFGRSVAISGDTIVVGAPYEDSAATGVNGDQSDNSAPRSGAAYVFTRTGTTWTQQAYLKASNTDAEDQFGYSVAVDGDRIIVGALYEGSAAKGVDGQQADNTATYAGAAYVFQRTGTTWAQAAYLKPFDTVGNERFGSSVAIAQDRVVAGALNKAAAYTFSWSGASWLVEHKLEPAHGVVTDRFGDSIAMSADRVVVGAPMEWSSATGVDGDQTDNNARDSGAAYIFGVDSSGWVQEAYLKASTNEAYMRFGTSLDISASTVVVGALYESSASAGPNGPQLTQLFGSTSPGAAYLFEHTGAGWAQTAYLKSSNPEHLDSFGSATAISGNLLIVGATGEDSGTSGVGSDQLDESASSAGAAYAFDLAGTWGAWRYGATTGANVADLYSTSSPIVGTPLTFELKHFDSDGVALLVVTTAATSQLVFGATLLVDLSTSIFGAALFVPVTITGGSGQLTVPVPAGTQGLTFFAQAFLISPMGPSKLEASSGLGISVQP